MPREIKILLPELLENESFDISIHGSTSQATICYRYQVWDLHKNNPGQIETALFLKQEIEKIGGNWVVAEIYAEENKKIPILLKQTKV